MRISNKTLSLLSASLFVVGLSAGLSAGCGSSSGSTDYAGTCNKLCAKEIACQADGGSGLILDQSTCMSICMQQANTTACPNAPAVSSALQACLNKSDCTAFSACVDSAPDCTTTGTQTGGTSGGGAVGGHGQGTGNVGGHATGGTTGATGGTTGAAGNGGTAECSVCTKGNSCCMALAPLLGTSPSQCTFSAADCSASADPATYASGCQQALSAGSAANIAACK